MMFGSQSLRLRSFCFGTYHGEKAAMSDPLTNSNILELVREEDWMTFGWILLRSRHTNLISASRSHYG